MERLQIRMFGELSLQFGDCRISDRDNRSRKVWQILAYLICHRGREVASAELIERIWGGQQEMDNPENVIKVTMHRARTLLNRLWPDAGRDLILRERNGYRWNDRNCRIDCEEFERLCREDPEAALVLYRGEFLSDLSGGTWVIPIATHYHNLYIQTVLTVVPGLLEIGEYPRAAEICTAALPAEPYHEALHRLLMRAHMAMGDPKGAVTVYEDLSKRLIHDFGITPGEETRRLYREASNSVGDRTMPIDTVLDHLLEQDPAAGALLCSFDAFRVLCHAEARAMSRSGKATHVALLSVAGAGSRNLARRSLETAMENLGEQIRLNLRRGDAFSKCSASQYVIMLPEANFENSCVVCRRVIGAFERRYPHSPATVHFMVRPLSADALNR